MALISVGGVSVVVLLVLAFLAPLSRFLDVRLYVYLIGLVWVVSTAILSGVV